MQYDLVFVNGRVIDPESKLDAIRSVAIHDGRIVAISEEKLCGKQEVDISNLILCPGFIDVHSHEHSDEYYALKCQDGVTSVFELEVGTNDIDEWYRQRENKTIVNYGVAIGHIQVRMKVFQHPPGFLPQSNSPAALRSDCVDEVLQELEFGLQRGALAMGFGIHYVPAATRWEISECFRLAKKYDVCCHVHMRHFGAQEVHGSLAALQEVLALGACTQAKINVCHVHSTCLSATSKALQWIEDAHRNGMDITTEFYPYLAGCSCIDSALFNDQLWQEQLGIGYEDLTYVNTGERLDAETFAKYRQEGGLVIINSIPEQAVVSCLRSPITLMGSDALRGHPRAAGSCSRILGRYVREQGVISWMEAIYKMTLLPAQRLESATDQMKIRGRLAIGAVADICIFNPATIIDRATYEQPKLPSQGIVHVLVNGTFVVRDEALVSFDHDSQIKLSGQPIRGRIQNE